MLNHCLTSLGLGVTHPWLLGVLTGPSAMGHDTFTQLTVSRHSPTGVSCGESMCQSTSYIRTSDHWHCLYSVYCRSFYGCTLLVQTESGVFLPVDAFSALVALLLKTMFSSSLTPRPALRKWRRLIHKKLIRSNVSGTTSPLRLSLLSSR